MSGEGLRTTTYPSGYVGGEEHGVLGLIERGETRRGAVAPKKL